MTYSLEWLRWCDEFVVNKDVLTGTLNLEIIYIYGKAQLLYSGTNSIVFNASETQFPAGLVKNCNIDTFKSCARRCSYLT